MHFYYENIKKINNLLDIEIVSKILLGAHLNFFEQHPLDYIYNSLNVRFLNLNNDN